jgi:hypothetical protein
MSVHCLWARSLPALRLPVRVACDRRPVASRRFCDDLVFVPQPARLFRQPACLSNPATRARYQPGWRVQEEGPPFLLASAHQLRARVHHNSSRQHEHALCARPSSFQPQPPGFFQIFFSRSFKHLRLPRAANQHICARATCHMGVYTEGHTNASSSHRLRPRSDQTHPRRQRRHASSQLRARPALLPSPLVVPPTPHRRSPG